MALSGCRIEALIIQLDLLLRLERTLLEAEMPDWGRLGNNLSKIEELFKLLPLHQKESDGMGKIQFDSTFHRQISKMIMLRRENLRFLQAKANKLGRQLAAFKQKKAAHRAYITYG